MSRIRKYTSEHYYIAPTKEQSGKRLRKYSSAPTTNAGGFAGGAGYLFSNLVAGGWGLFENTGRYFQGKFYDVTGNHKMAEYTFAKESFSEKMAREATEEFNPNGAMQFAGAVSQGLGQSLVQMGISAIPCVGKGLSLGLTGSSSNAAAISNYVRTTGELDSVKAYGYGFTVSGIEVGLEAALGVGMKAGGGKLGTTFIGKLTGKTGTKSVGKAIAGVAKDAFEEGLEEAIAEIADPLLQRAWGMNPDATIDWGQVLYAGAVGAAAGGLLSGAGTAIQTGTSYSRGKSIVANGTADVWTGAAQSAIGRYDSRHYNTKTGNETLIELKKELGAYNANPNKTGTNAMIQLGNIKRYTTALQVSNIVAEASRGFQSMDIKDAEVYASFLSGLVSGVKVNGAELLANKQLDNGMGAADLLAICWFGGAMRGDFNRFRAELEAEAYNAQRESLGINTEAGAETAADISGENADTSVAGVENSVQDGANSVQGVDGEGKKRYNKIAYNEYNTNVMQWAFSARTKPGDSKMFYDSQNNTWNKLVADTSEERYHTLSSVKDTSENAEIIQNLFNEVRNENYRAESGASESIRKNIDQYWSLSIGGRDDSGDAENQRADGRDRSLHREKSQSDGGAAAGTGGEDRGGLTKSRNSMEGAENAQEATEATEGGETVTEEEAKSTREALTRRRKRRKELKEEGAELTEEEKAEVDALLDESAENVTDEGETDTAEDTTEDTAEDPAETERGKREAGWYTAEVQDKARSMVRGFDMMHPDTRARILEMIASGQNVDKKTLAALANVMAANFTLHVKFRNDMPTGGFRYRSDSGATMILLSTKATAEVLDHVVLEEVWHGVQGTKLAKDAETLLKRIVGEDAVAAEAKKYRDEFVKHFGEDAANKQLTEDALMDEAYANLFAKYGKEAQFLSRFARIAKGRFARVFGRIADLARTQKAKSELSYRQLMKLYRAYRKAVFSAGIDNIAAIRAVMQRMGEDEEEKENASNNGEARYSLVGRTEDGRGIYRSNYPKNTPKDIKQKDIIDLVQNVWSKKPIQLNLVVDGKDVPIEAKFNPELAERSDLSKIAFGNRKGTNSEKRITLDLSSDLYQIAEESKYVRSKIETGKDNPAHFGVTEWHYFLTNLVYVEEDGTQIDCHMNIDVKQNGDGYWFYSFAIEKGVAPRTLLAGVTEESATTPDYSIPDMGEKINPSAKKSSKKSSGANSMAGAKKITTEMTDETHVGMGQSNGDYFTEDKYFKSQMSKWSDLKHGSFVKVGTITEKHPIHAVGLPAGTLRYDVDKLKRNMEDHGDYLNVELLKRIPDIVANPIAISEYSVANTVSVFGDIFVGTSPMMVGVTISKDRGGNDISKVRTFNARRDVGNLITDDTVLYLNENKKRTRKWFQACGIQVPLGETKFGFIRSISQDHQKSNPFSKKSSGNNSMQGVNLSKDERDAAYFRAQATQNRAFREQDVVRFAEHVKAKYHIEGAITGDTLTELFRRFNNASDLSWNGISAEEFADDISVLLLASETPELTYSGRFGKEYAYFDMAEALSEDVLNFVQSGGLKTLYAQNQDLRKKISELKATARDMVKESKDYYNATSDIVIKTHKIREKYMKIKHSSGSMMGDPVLQEMLRQLGTMARGKYFYEAGAKKVAELFKQFLSNRRNEVLGYVDVVGMLGDDVIPGDLDSIINAEAKRFGLDEIRAVDRMINAVLNLYKNYNKVYYQSRHVELDKLAEDGIKQIDAGKAVFLTKDGKPSALLRTLRTLYPMITPTALTRMVEGFAKDGILSGYMQEIVNDADRATALRNEWMYQIDDYIAKHKGFKNKLAKTTVQFKGHEIPLGEAIHLYMLSKREQAAEALAVSAISYRDANGEKQVIKGMEFDSEADNASDVMAQAIKDMRALFSKLYNGFDADTKGFIRVLEQFYELAKAAKKATDLKYLGYTNVIEGYYVPILRAGIQRSAVEGAAGLVTNEIQSMHNFRFNKSTVKNRVPLELNDAYDLAANHANGVARYTCMYGSLTSFDRWYNFKVSGSEDIKSVSDSAKDVLPQFNAYIRKLLSDVQGIRPNPEALDGFSSFIRGALTTSALGANIATPLKQHAGYFTALQHISMKNLMRGGVNKAFKTNMVIVDKQDLDEMMKHSPAAAVRYYKYEDSARARAEANLEKLGRIASKTTILIDRADMAMVMHLWSACKYQIQDDTGHGIDTEENHKLAGELLNKVINETQGTYSAATRTGLQRSRNEFAKAITMFSSDSAKQLTMIAESVFRVVYYRRANAEARKNGTEAPYSAEQIRKAIKDSARATSGVVIGQIAFVLIGMLVNYGLFNKDYGEDEEENKAIALTKTFGKEFGLAMAGIVPVLDDILSFFLDGYEVSSPSFDAVNDVLNAFGGIFNVVSKGCSGEKVENHEWRRAIRDIIYSASGFVGLPVRNVYNTFAGIWRRFSEYGKTAEKAFWYGTSSKDLNEAVSSEDEEYAAKVVGLIAKNEQTGEMHKDVANELARLYVGQYVSSGQYRSVVRNVGSTYADAEGNVTAFTAKERKKVQELYAKADGAVASLISTEQYAALDDEQKADAIGKIYDAYYRMAVAEAVEGRAPYRRACAYALVENESIFFAALAYAVDLKADAKYTKKQKLMQYLSAQDLSRYEKSVILWASGYDSEEVSSYIKSYLRKNGSEEDIAFAKQIGAIAA